MNRFETNQNVVCVKDSTSNSQIKKLSVGKNYTVTNCGLIRGKHVVQIQGFETALDGSNGWYIENDFAPLEEDGSTKELAEAMVEHLGGEKKEEMKPIRIKQPSIYPLLKAQKELEEMMKMMKSILNK